MASVLRCPSTKRRTGLICRGQTGTDFTQFLLNGALWRGRIVTSALDRG
jgi:hypothetical protein